MLHEVKLVRFDSTRSDRTVARINIDSLLTPEQVERYVAETARKTGLPEALLYVRQNVQGVTPPLKGITLPV